MGTISDYVFDNDVNIEYPRRPTQKNKQVNKILELDHSVASEFRIYDKKKKNCKSVRNQISTISYYVFGENLQNMSHSHACKIFNKHPPNKTLDEEDLYDDSDFMSAYHHTKSNHRSSEKITKPLIEEIFRPSFHREIMSYKDLIDPNQSNHNIDFQIPTLENIDFVALKHGYGSTKDDYKTMDNKVDVELSCHLTDVAKPFPGTIDSHGSPILFPHPCYKPVSRAVESKHSSTILQSEDVFPSVKMDWEDYHRLEVIHNFMDSLEQEFPALCTVDTIGQSIEGRNLKILKISNSEASNSAVWIDSGIHAREWIGPAVNTYIANHIARNFDSLPDYITSKDWYFLPVVNPDGYEYSHTKNRMWRKNRAWYAGECVGVDLNRNFSFNWGGRGSSNNPTHSFYRGPEPFSEPESNAIRDFMTNSGIKFKVYLTLHSFGQVIIFPFASSDDLCADYIRLLQGATIMSRAIYETNGSTYKVGVSKDVMYTASGTSNDWCYASVGIPYCYLIELRSKQHKFKLPKEEINETGNEILNCVKALVEFADNTVCDYKHQHCRRFIT